MPVAVFLWECDVGLSYFCSRQGAPVSGKKVCVVFPCLFVFRDPVQDILKPRPFIDAACLAGGKQGVVDLGHPLCSIVVTAEQIVLPALCWQ